MGRVRIDSALVFDIEFDLHSFSNVLREYLNGENSLSWIEVRFPRFGNTAHVVLDEGIRDVRFAVLRFDNRCAMMLFKSWYKGMKKREFFEFLVKQFERDLSDGLKIVGDVKGGRY